MSIKDNKLGTKLFGGFSVVLVLSAVVAYVGYNGLTGVVDRVEKGDDVNRLVKGLLDTRLLENAYIIRDDHAYVVKVEEKIKEIIRQAKETRGKFKQKVSKDQMDLVIKEVKEYFNTFKGYVDLNRQRDETMEEMQARAMEALSHVEAIRGDQKAQLEKGHDDSKAFLDDKMAKAADANRIIKLYIDARMNEKEFIASGGEQKWKDAADSRIAEILELAVDMKSRFEQAKNLDQIFEIRTAVMAYSQALDKCGELMQLQSETINEMRTKGLTAKEKIDAIRSDQTKEIQKVVKNTDIDRKDFGRFLNTRLTKADNANQLVKWFIDIKMNENKFITSYGEQKWKDAIHDKITKILGLAAKLKSRLRIPKSRRQIKEAVAALKAYGDAFDKFDQLMQGINESIVTMKKRALEALEKAEAIREDQNAQLDEARKKNAAFMDDKMVKSDDANQISKWFMEARKNEKEFILSGGQKKWKDNVEDSIAKILKLSEALKSRLRLSKNKEQIDEVLVAVRVYGQAFDRFEEMIQQQNVMNQKMLAVARQTEKAFEDVRADQKAKMENQMSAAKALIGFVTAVVIFVGILLAWIISKGITRPLSEAVAGLKDIAEGEGDLTTRLEVRSRDEVGELAKWFNIFIGKLHEIIKDIAGNAETLNASSKDLSGLSGQMSEGVDNMSSKSNTVAVSVEEMSSNMTSVAAAMEQAATNVNMVATSTEEMTATVNEIAQNSEKARITTQEAVSQAESVSNKVDELGKAATEIGKVTEAITEISEQTNLLALNATIEAARAGEAGKGFAVVANEIKELARQTAEATQNIKERIGGIQGTTAATVTEIEQISYVINNVNKIVSSIATAVEEQSVTTREIAGNVAQTSQGIQEVNKSVAQNSNVSEEIAKDIADVNQAASEMSNSSSQVDSSSNDLSKLAEKLRGTVVRFKLD